MTILTDISQLQSIAKPVVLAIGVFDGVHLGHLSVLHTAQQEALGLSARPVVFTFDPHPAKVLRPKQAPRMLCSREHELLLLQREGIDTVLLCPFTLETAQLSPLEFVNSLMTAAKALVGICVGEDWRFGKGREGNVDALRTIGDARGFSVLGLPVKEIDGQPISSTRIRRHVSEGDLTGAKRLLGRAYSVFGEVIEGQKLARTLGFPTANVAVETEQLPPAGVYAVRVWWQDAWHDAVANLGFRPTVTPVNQDLSLEVHVLDGHFNLYGEKIEVEFIGLIRPEQKFADLQSLAKQIALDVEASRNVLTEHSAE